MFPSVPEEALQFGDGPRGLCLGVCVGTECSLVSAETDDQRFLLQCCLKELNVRTTQGSRIKVDINYVPSINWDSL